MSSRVGVASQEVYFCASDSTCSTSFASNFLTIGTPAFTSLVVNFPHSAALGGYQDSYSHHVFVTRWLVTPASIQKIVARISKTRKKCRAKEKPRILFSKFCDFPDLAPPRNPYAYPVHACATWKTDPDRPVPLPTDEPVMLFLPDFPSSIGIQKVQLRIEDLLVDLSRPGTTIVCDPAISCCGDQRRSCQDTRGSQQLIEGSIVSAEGSVQQRALCALVREDFYHLQNGKSLLRLLPSVGRKRQRLSAEFLS